MTQVWKMPLKSRRSDFEKDPAKVDRARTLCFDKGWVGVGWGIDSLPDNRTDPDVYERELRKNYKKRAAISAHRALAHKMRDGDLVWCRAKGDIYWLGRVKGPWKYRSTGRFDEFDLYQIRTCKWVKVGPGDTVPGPVKNAYAGRGSAISRIHREHDAALCASAYIWQKLTGEAIQHIPAGSGKFSLSAIGHDDLEDLVALYLQAELGWYVVPSTAKRSTPHTEFVLRNAKGKRAYLQVKSGETSVDRDIQIPRDVDIFFIFDLMPDGQHAASEKLVRIDMRKLEKFARTHQSLLPRYMQQLNF